MSAEDIAEQEYREHVESCLDAVQLLSFLPIHPQTTIEGFQTYAKFNGSGVNVFGSVTRHFADD